MIDFLHTEAKLVAWVRHDILIYHHAFNGIFNDVQAIIQFFKNREIYFLEQLKIAEIAAWQITRHASYLNWHGDDLVAVSPY